MPDSEPFFVNKWLTFSACAALQFTAALSYTFGLFSADLKTRFGWSQSELTGFGTAMNFGAFAAIIPGYIYSSLSATRHGPRCGDPTSNWFSQFSGYMLDIAHRSAQRVPSIPASGTRQVNVLAAAACSNVHHHAESWGCSRAGSPS